MNRLDIAPVAAVCAALLVAAAATAPTPAFAQTCAPTKIGAVLADPLDLYEIDGRFFREAKAGEIAAGGEALECQFTDHVVVGAEEGWRLVRRSSIRLASEAGANDPMSRCMCATDFAQEDQLAAPASVVSPMCPASTCQERAAARARTGRSG